MTTEWTDQPPPVTTPRPGLANVAMISNSLPPYRLYLHQRINREIPQINLWTVCTHTVGDKRWKMMVSPDIRPVIFARGDSWAVQDRLTHAPAEWRKAGRIIRWIIDNHVRAIVLMGYNDLGRLRLIRWCKRNNVACVLYGDGNIWGDSAAGWRRKVKARVVRWAVRNSAAVMACGDCGKAYFRKYGAREERLFYHPYEPDYDLIQNLPSADIERPKSHYRLSDTRRRLIFSARMDPVKRPDLVLDALLAIADRRSQWDLIMVGDGPLREMLESRVPPALKSRLTWTGFVNDQAVVSALYRLSDVLVLPSDFEPWALVINEAVAAGLAVVCSSVVGAAEQLVRDGVNGRIFPAGDLQQLTECLLDVTDPRNIDAMKANSPHLLAEWRKRGDPVEGLRQALVACDGIPGPLR